MKGNSKPTNRQLTKTINFLVTKKMGEQMEEYAKKNYGWTWSAYLRKKIEEKLE